MGKRVIPLPARLTIYDPYTFTFDTNPQHIGPGVCVRFSGGVKIAPTYQLIHLMWSIHIDIEIFFKSEEEYHI